jgi:hypothetical protein
VHASASHRFACVSDEAITYLLTWFVNVLDFDVTADISRFQDVRNKKVLSTSCVIAIR